MSSLVVVVILATSLLNSCSEPDYSDCEILRDPHDKVSDDAKFPKFIIGVDLATSDHAYIDQLVGSIASSIMKVYKDGAFIELIGSGGTTSSVITSTCFDGNVENSPNYVVNPNTRGLRDDIKKVEEYATETTRLFLRQVQVEKHGTPLPIFRAVEKSVLRAHKESRVTSVDALIMSPMLGSNVKESCLSLDEVRPPDAATATAIVDRCFTAGQLSDIGAHSVQLTVTPVPGETDAQVDLAELIGSEVCNRMTGCEHV